MNLHEQFIQQKELSSKKMNDEAICNAVALHLSFTGIFKVVHSHWLSGRTVLEVSVWSKSSPLINLWSAVDTAGNALAEIQK